MAGWHFIRYQPKTGVANGEQPNPAIPDSLT